MDKLNVDQLVVESMLLFHDELEKKQLDVHVDETETVPIFADEKATNRIVTNIIQNATRYAKSYLTVNLMEEERYVRLRAANDTSEDGLPEAGRIFDRTFRPDPSRSAANLGLGLHIVQQLAEKQGGKVSADIEDHEFRLDVFFRKWD